MKRRKAREFALQILFQGDFKDEKIDRKDLEEFWSDKKVDGNIKEFTEELVNATKPFAWVRMPAMKAKAISLRP